MFFPGKQSAYVYNSLADFYTDANDYLANPNRTTSPVTLRTFQVRWNNIPGAEKPLQPLEVQYTGAYAQDVWQAKSNFSLTYGIRFDVPVFGDTGYANAVADAMTFMDENGDMVQYSTAKLPDPKFLWSPRVGFNWDVFGNRNTQVRGGTGIFTGKPAYVWISNQIGNTGVLTGFESISQHHGPAVQPEYREVQADDRDRRARVELRTGAHRSGLQVPADLAHQHRRRPAPAGRLGRDARVHVQQGRQRRVLHQRQPDEPEHDASPAPTRRPRWSLGGTANRINPTVANAIVLKNQNVGSAWNISGSLERTYRGRPLRQGRVPVRRGQEHRRPRFDRVRLLEQQPAFVATRTTRASGTANSSPGHRVFAAGSLHASTGSRR